MSMIHLRITKELKESIQAEAEKRGMTMNGYCALVLGAHQKVMKELVKSWR